MWATLTVARVCVSICYQDTCADNAAEGEYIPETEWTITAVQNSVVRWALLVEMTIFPDIFFQKSEKEKILQGAEDDKAFRSCCWRHLFLQDKTCRQSKGY